MQAKTENQQDGADDSWSFGKVMETATQRRIQIPDAVWRKVDLTKDGDSKEVMVELVSPGHIRLHRLSEAAPRVKELRTKLGAEAKDNSIARRNLGAVGDKYRQVILYDGPRLPLPVELTTYLGIEPYEVGRKLYVQAAAGTIDVMTMEMRMQYLDESRHEITI